MIIDLHTHSHASDGALSPEELLTRAHAAGVQRFAITDHDTVAGYEAARAWAERPAGMELVPGVELSCLWSGVGIHVVGLGMDIDHPGFRAGLEMLDDARARRARGIADKLAERGMPGALEGASALAGTSQIGRPHFAAWMVREGHVQDPGEAFDRFLGAGKVGDIKTFWPGLAEATGWIVAAGGSAVLAHPLKYRMTRMKLRRLLRDFKAAGGRVLEVHSGRQTTDQTIDLCKLADDEGMAVSAGSDYHRDFDYGPSLGVDCTRLPAFVRLWAPEAGPGYPA